MKITLVLDVPDGTTFQVNPVAAIASEGQYVPPFEDELIPLPDGAMPVPGDVVAPTPFRGAAQNPGPSVCPVHRLPWKVVPAGISRKTGQPYGAFTACPERGCDQRPAA